MLARLDKVPGVAESRANWEGQLVLILLTPDASLETVLAGARSVLGPRTRRLDPAAEGEHISSFRRGGLWMSSKETLRMSRHEAQVLGKRFADRAGERAKLSERQRQRLESLLVEDINAAFERNHATGEGLGAAATREWSGMEARFTRALDFMTSGQIDFVVEELRALAGMDPCGK